MTLGVRILEVARSNPGEAIFNAQLQRSYSHLTPCNAAKDRDFGRALKSQNPVSGLRRGRRFRIGRLLLQAKLRPYGHAGRRFAKAPGGERSKAPSPRPRPYSVAPFQVDRKSRSVSQGRSDRVPRTYKLSNASQPKRKLRRNGIMKPRFTSVPRPSQELQPSISRGVYITARTLAPLYASIYQFAVGEN
jgi:hypothetical protein